MLGPGTISTQVVDQGLNAYSAWSGKNRKKMHDQGRDVSKCFIRDDSA